LAENASFDVLIDKIRSAVCRRRRQVKRRKEKKRKGGTQSYKTLYFSYLWGGHLWADSRKIWRACCTSRLIHNI